VFEEVISSYGQTFFFFQLLLHVPQFLIRTDRLNSILNSFIGSIAVSAILVVFFLMMYSMLYVIPSKAKEYIAKAHPEYNLV